MRRDLDSLSQVFDLLVIGGGIHGACIARTAAMAGLKVALIEKGDFSGAVSRNSAKLIHGGLRYIQHFDIPRIRESMLSQRTWFRFAPHLMRPLRFVIPTYGYTTRGPVALAGGIAAFHMIAAGRNRGIRQEIRLPRSGLMGRSTLAATHPVLDRDDVTGGAYWYDGQMLDACRVTIECIRDAVESGAAAANHVEAVSLLHGSSGVQGVTARDRISGAEFEIRARLTVNATGPWVDRVLKTGPAALHGQRTTAWTRNINLVTRRLYPGQEALGIASNRASDAAVGKAKRLFFASPWHGCTVVGTTHDHFDDDPNALLAPKEVIAGFLQEVDAAAPGFGLKLDDVRSIHLGLTPAEAGESERAKRSHVLDHEQLHGVAGLVSVAGIKYTTAPIVGAKVVRLAGARLGRTLRIPPFEQPCGGAPRDMLRLPPDESIDDTAKPDDEYAWAVAVYGARSEECLGEPSTENRDEEQVFRNRVTFGVKHEMVVRLSDAILRATDWAERGKLTPAQLEWSATALASMLGWSPERTARELAETRELLEQLYVSMPDRPSITSAA